MDDNPTPRKWSAAWLSCGCLLILLMFLVLIPGIMFLLWNERNAREIERRLATVRREGLPASLDDLKEFSRLPRSKTDTTDLWLEGVAPLVGPSVVQAAKAVPIVGQGEFPKLGKPWEKIGEAAGFLTTHAKSLEKFHEAAKLGGEAVFPINYHTGTAGDLSCLQNQRAAARILMLEALVNAHRGDARQCAESIQGLFAVEQSLKHAPFLVSYQVQMAVRGMAIQALAETMGCVPFTDEDLRSFQAELRTWDNTDSLKQAIATERVGGCEMFQGGQLPGAVKTPILIPTYRADFALYLEVFEDFYTAAETGFPEALSSTKSIKTKAMSRTGLLRAITLNLIPAIDATFRATARTLTTARAADLAIAVVLFHRKNGELPESLTQLTPDLIPTVPTDAFNGAPLTYRKVADGFVVYGLGINAVDNGGDPNQKTPLDDVVHVRMATVNSNDGPPP